MSNDHRRRLFDERFLARLEQLHLLAKRLSSRGVAGGRRSRRLGDGLEFADHRDYAAGDDVRFIDWPYYARMEKLLLRMFHEHSDSDVVILLDCSASMAACGDEGPGETCKFDYARRTAAALAYVAMGSLERVTCVPFSAELGTPLRTGRNRGQILDVLDYLVELQAAGQTDLVRCVDMALHQFEPQGTIVILSDLLDSGEALRPALTALHRRCEPVVIQIYSPQDAKGLLEGPVELHQAETGAEMAVDVTGELLASYRQQWEKYRSACERSCLACAATYVAAPTDAPFDQLVLQTLRRAGVLS